MHYSIHQMYLRKVAMSAEARVVTGTMREVENHAGSAKVAVISLLRKGKQYSNSLLIIKGNWCNTHNHFSSLLHLSRQSRSESRLAQALTFNSGKLGSRMCIPSWRTIFNLFLVERRGSISIFLSAKVACPSLRSLPNFLSSILIRAGNFICHAIEVHDAYFSLGQTGFFLHFHLASRNPTIQSFGNNVPA